jgi:hypothetical protein
MTKQRLVIGLAALPFPPRWLPGIALGVTGSVAAFLIYLAAVRGL